MLFGYCDENIEGVESKRSHSSSGKKRRLRSQGWVAAVASPSSLRSSPGSSRRRTKKRNGRPPPRTESGRLPTLNHGETRGQIILNFQFDRYDKSALPGMVGFTYPLLGRDATGATSRIKSSLSARR